MLGPGLCRNVVKQGAGDLAGPGGGERALPEHGFRRGSVEEQEPLLGQLARVLYVGVFAELGEEFEHGAFVGGRGFAGGVGRIRQLGGDVDKWTPAKLGGLEPGGVGIEAGQQAPDRVGSPVLNLCGEPGLEGGGTAGDDGRDE